MENIFKFMRDGKYDDMRLFLLRIGYGILTKIIKSCSKSKSKMRKDIVFSKLSD